MTDLEDLKRIVKFLEAVLTINERTTTGNLAHQKGTIACVIGAKIKLIKKSIDNGTGRVF